MKNIEIKSLSEKGRRETNQDSLLELRLERFNVIFLAIADGMGGVAGGKIAADLVLKTCAKIVEEKFREEVSPDLKQVLRKIFFEAQLAIKNEITAKPEFTGMGTTLSCVLISNNDFVWGNLGDTRIYFYSKDKLRLITKDHTHIQEFLDENSGPITQSLIDNYGNYLTRSIDGGTDEPDIYPEYSNHEQLKNGDIILICSDGLIVNKAVDYSNTFIQYLVCTKNITEAASKLYEMAYENGSSDNITLILLEKGKIKRRRKSKLTKKVAPNGKIKPLLNSNKERKKKLKALGLAIILLAIVTLLSLYQEFATNEDSNMENFYADNNATILNDSTDYNKNLRSNTNNSSQNNHLNSYNSSDVDSIQNMLIPKNKMDGIENSSADKMIEVPKLIGLTYNKSVALLKKNELVFEKSSRKGPAREIDLVVKQFPEAGSKVKPKTKIKIIVGE